MGNIKLIFKIIERVMFMFCYGEKFHNMKSMIFVEYANYLHDKKNIEKAIIYYNKALNFNQSNFYAYGGLTAAFIEKRFFKEALGYCNKAIEIKKQDILTHILLMVIYESLGESILAKEALQKALKFYNGNLAAVYNRLAYTYFQLDLHKEAEYYSHEAIKIDPNEVGLHNNLAKIYLAQKRFQEAKDEFKKVLELTNDRRYKRYAKKEIEKIEVQRVERGQ